MPTLYSVCTAYVSGLVPHQVSEAGWTGPVTHFTDEKIHEGSVELLWLKGRAEKLWPRNSGSGALRELGGGKRPRPQCKPFPGCWNCAWLRA